MEAHKLHYQIRCSHHELAGGDSDITCPICARSGTFRMSEAIERIERSTTLKRTNEPVPSCSYAVSRQAILMRSAFHLPNREELVLMGPTERLNNFRRFFASSRYGRLIIQQLLVRSAIDNLLAAKVVSLETNHNQEFLDVLKTVSEYGFLDEFVVAVREEDTALQKIIEAYDKRMEGRM